MKKRSLILSSILLITGLFSCSSPASQCKQLASVTQSYQTLRDGFKTDIESAQVAASGAKNLAEVQDAAAQYTAAVDTVTSQLDEMIQDLSGLNISDPQLDEYRESYIINLTDSQNALSRAGEAMASVRDAESEEALRKVFNQYQTEGNQAYDDILTLGASESALVEQVNEYCGQAVE